MPRKCGRPPKSEAHTESRQKIIDAAVELISRHGADALTVRRVCAAADLSIGTFYHSFNDKDDLMMYFLRETSSDDFQLATPIENIADRISELYMCLIHRYMELGEPFMKSFYTTRNRAISAYMGEQEGRFVAGTVMDRSERELAAAVRMGIIKEGLNLHAICQDICVIIKGCVFEWCLNDSKPDIEASVYRIVGNYLSVYLDEGCDEHKAD